MDPVNIKNSSFIANGSICLHWDHFLKGKTLSLPSHRRPLKSAVSKTFAIGLNGLAKSYLHLVKFTASSKSNPITFIGI